MRRAAIVAIVFLFIALMCSMGYCQSDEDSESSGGISDPGTDAQLGEELGSQQAEGEEGLYEADAMMDSHSTSQTEVDTIMDSGD